jgi:pimeloyl-ACP methyl ester carboxylesterase
MVIHGKLDEDVSFSHGYEMHQAIPEEFRRDPWWVPDRGHNDITDGPGKMTEYIRRLRTFLAGLDEE